MDRFTIQDKIIEKTKGMRAEELIAGLQSAMTTLEFNKFLTAACLKLNRKIFTEKTALKIMRDGEI